MKTVSVQKLIAKGYSFTTIAVDPETKCEYFVSNTLSEQDAWGKGANSIAIATSWKERKTPNSKIATYNGDVNKLK